MKEQEINNNQKPVKIWKRKNIHLVNQENDIKFHGPLSYRYLRIAGWLFLFISQLSVIFGLANSLKVGNFNSFLITFFSSFGDLVTPLFLFAAFAQVLTAKDGYRKLLFTYGLGAIGVFLLFLIVYFHFALTLLHSVTGSWKDAYSTAETFFSIFSSSGVVAFNIFIDLILCTLVTFFLNYRPTHHFQDKKIYIFRCFVAFPIIYELASIILKLLAASSIINIPPLVMPLLTTKPPVAFFIFLVLALFVKNREKYYIKHGKTHEEYKEFLHTNVNKLHFSLFLISVVIAAVVLDVVLLVVISAFRLIPYSEMEPEALSNKAFGLFQNTYEMGFGKCVPMLVIIPLLIFFDYTKTHKNKLVDVIIPVAGISLIILLYIEGMFQLLSGYIADFMKKIEETGEKEQDENPEAKFKLIVNTIKNIFRR